MIGRHCTVALSELPCHGGSHFIPFFPHAGRTAALFFLSVGIFPTANHAQHAFSSDAVFAPRAAPVEDDTFAKQERLLRSRFSAITLDPSGHLPIFGENIFQSEHQATLSNASLYLPKGYLLGPGDVLGVYLLGKANQELRITVAADGNVYLPSAGVVAVAGHTLDEAAVAINNTLSRVFGGYNLQLILITPKMVSIDVTGEVRHPGRYPLSALNTVLDALAAAGGVSPLGSLRQLQLFRTNAAAQTIDLYPFLLQPDSRDEHFLQSGDRIYVPPAHNWIALTGELSRPGIYELGGTPLALQDALVMAGGATPLADLDNLELSHLDESGQRHSQTISLHASNGTPTLLRHGDRVRVYSLLQRLQQPTVAIYGEVRQPGTFPFEEGWYVSDLIQKAGGLTRSAYLSEAEIARVDPGKPPHIIKFSLQQLAEGDTLTNPAVREDDQIFIRRIPDWDVGPVVEIRGEVHFPGVYPIARYQTTLRDIVAQAGGFASRALLRDARLMRPRLRPAVAAGGPDSIPSERLTNAEYQDFVMRQDVAALNQVSVNFHKLFVAGDNSYDVVLQPGDLIEVPRTDSLVYVSGRVGLPGGVPFVAGKGIDYYIKMAGGTTHDAVRRKTKVILASGETVDDEKVARPDPGDVIWVPRKADHSGWDAVRDIVTMMAQLATIYVVVDQAMGN